MDSTLAKLAAFAITFLGSVVAYKQLNLPGWETSACIGGILLYVVIAFLIGQVFKTDILDSFWASLLITGVVMFFFHPGFGFVMIMIFFLILLIAMGNR
ncbi:hypothetical protein [Methanoculleus thermophilus]|uniref:Uncharacterized protein n=1 Tax=Methanoculleus thermophilus TaxID=2200 RepID=A0A1G9B310_9EURY|nr:hypothetical protein [Methanoculleus thermophilus]SDK33195.1 hypothetical protein SAMN04488571_107136 [Methanoculleus thermophilus]